MSVLVGAASFAEAVIRQLYNIPTVLPWLFVLESMVWWSPRFAHPEFRGARFLRALTWPAHLVVVWGPLPVRTDTRIARLLTEFHRFPRRSARLLDNTPAERFENLYRSWTYKGFDDRTLMYLHARFLEAEKTSEPSQELGYRTPPCFLARLGVMHQLEQPASLTAVLTAELRHAGHTAPTFQEVRRALAANRHLTLDHIMGLNPHHAFEMISHHGAWDRGNLLHDRWPEEDHRAVDDVALQFLDAFSPHTHPNTDLADALAILEDGPHTARKGWLSVIQHAIARHYRTSPKDLAAPHRLDVIDAVREEITQMRAEPEKIPAVLRLQRAGAPGSYAELALVAGILELDHVTTDDSINTAAATNTDDATNTDEAEE